MEEQLPSKKRISRKFRSPKELRLFSNLFLYFIEIKKQNEMLFFKELELLSHIHNEFRSSISPKFASKFLYYLVIIKTRIYTNTEKVILINNIIDRQLLQYKPYSVEYKDEKKEKEED